MECILLNELINQMEIDLAKVPMNKEQRTAADEAMNGMKKELEDLKKLANIGHAVIKAFEKGKVLVKFTGVNSNGVILFDKVATSTEELINDESSL